MRRRKQASDAGHERERPDFLLSKHIDLRYCAGGFYQSLRYMDAYNTGKGRRAGRLAAFASEKYAIAANAAFPLRG
jgi:hypothetical protein